MAAGVVHPYLISQPSLPDIVVIRDYLKLTIVRWMIQKVPQ